MIKLHDIVKHSLNGILNQHPPDSQVKPGMPWREVENNLFELLLGLKTASLDELANIKDSILAREKLFGIADSQVLGTRYSLFLYVFCVDYVVCFYLVLISSYF